MFKIPINVSNQKDISSVIGSIVEGLGQNVESSIISEILNDFHKQNTPQQSNKKKQAPAPNMSNMSNMLNTLFDNSIKTEHTPSEESEYRYELSESSESFVISIDIPGVNKEDILISYDNNILHVECDRKPTDACLVVIKSNVVYGNKSLDLHLKDASSGVNPSDVLASYNTGTLVVSIPKKSKSKSNNYINVQ